MPNPTITALPTAPARSMQPATFVTTADAFLAALATFVTEANALGVAVEADAVATAADRVAVAADKATVAADKAIVAADKATVAADKALVAADKTSAEAAATNAAASAAVAAGAAAFVDTNPIVKGSGDATKQVRIEVDTNVPTGTTVVLTAPGTDGTLVTSGANTFTGAQVLSDQQVSRALLIDTGIVNVDKGNSGTSTQTLDYTAGHVQKVTATGNFTLATSNWPPTGNRGIMILKLVNGGAYTITWPTINWIKPDGSTTTSFATWLAAVNGRTALQTSGIDEIKLETDDAGTTIYGRFA